MSLRSELWSVTWFLENGTAICIPKHQNMPFHSRMISAWPYHWEDCSADQQSCGKDRENFISCSFNIIYLFFKYVKRINRPEKWKLYVLLLKRITDLGLYCVDQDTGNRSCSVISNMLFCTHTVFVIIFSNLKFIIFEDQGKYWHI